METKKRENAELIRLAATGNQSLGFPNRADQMHNLKHSHFRSGPGRSQIDSSTVLAKIAERVQGSRR
jgi:hypothetical protein